MFRSVLQFQNFVSLESPQKAVIEPVPKFWSVAEIMERLVEISGAEARAALTVAVGLVLEAQRQGEPVAWVAPTESSFYPPDAAEGGAIPGPATGSSPTAGQPTPAAGSPGWSPSGPAGSRSTTTGTSSAARGG